ncbi:putative receptor-like protein kinase At3g47110 [Andrographis paniculata]|uniref:putative receptor-like protein kinase At3g47110 n=1 Tax=Andrographis paniculata TaxID=175694 RepID=UPI0021E86F0C|nr:putative receptor-like protein kinase At3g47110 [Andrographis paniculata]
MALITHFSTLIISILTTTASSSSSSSSSSPSNNGTDYQSLLEFNNSITHDPSQTLISWTSHTHYCTWKGITCSRTPPGRVLAITLKNRGLIGTLSPSIANISFLRSLDLSNNSFHGRIPDDLGRLMMLEFVELSSNSFSGLIPTNLSQCPNLIYLNLIENHLHGNIPFEYSYLHKIQQLGLGKNNLSGTIPNFLGNLTHLTQLHLARCNLIGQIPESLQNLKNMKFITFPNNYLSGKIPSGLFNISSMVDLSLSNNQLEGSLPSTMGLTLPNLRVLTIGFNQLTGPFPTSMANASSLRRLDFPMNFIAGPIPATLGRLSNLTQFLAASNSIRDDVHFITSFVNCTLLQILDMAENPVSGVLPEAIVNFSSSLWAINLPLTRIQGTLPSDIGNLVGLTFLSLYGNRLEGSIPTSIGELSKLQMLNLGANRFNGEVPDSIGDMDSLNYVYLQSNRLSGRIPASLGRCMRLLSLDLSGNNFTGSIPGEVLKLSSISILLDLSFNELNGSLPSEVHSLRHLSALNVSNNRLSGAIPSSISECISLEWLQLRENRFEGEIPQRLGDLNGLRYLDLSRNNLSGSIPSSLSELQLQSLNLSFNRFDGEVPMIGVFANRTAVSLEGNENLCGGIPDLNLPRCAQPSSSKKNLLSLLMKILIPIVAVLLIFLSIFLYKKRNKNEDVALSSPRKAPFIRLSYGDLERATDGFSESNLVGAGRFGTVYKGVLDDDHTLIAVKVLNLSVHGASKSFLKECNALRQVRHRNVSKILSVCEGLDFKGDDFKSLVYEFKENGSLEEWLHRYREGELHSLDIGQRLDIAIDIAQGLEYLHCATDSTIVHGDLKPSNILLDRDMTACVADFGLAKIVSSVSPSYEGDSSIGVEGTIGYVPPEYSVGNKVCTEGDVYSYGILVLEMFTNRRPTDVDEFKDHSNLHNYVAAALALPNSIDEIVDGVFRTGGDEVKNCLVSVLRIGVVCSKENPKDRMQMTQVVAELHKIKDRYLL